MQVLVKFVSCVGVRICLWYSHSSRSFCLKLEKKNPPADFRPAKLVLLFFLLAAGVGGGGRRAGLQFIFPFQWFFKDGARSGL